MAKAARNFGVGWHTAMAAVRDHGQPLVEDPARLDGVEALGLDETVMLHGGARRHTTYITGFVDLHRGRLLDIALGRSGSVVETWLAERDENWRADIDVVALDPFRGYANGLLAQLGHATVVLDHFHAIRLANAAVDDVRRRVQQEVLGHRGRKGDPLYGIRRLLLVGAERLGERGRVRIAAGLAAGDRFDEVGAAWTAKSSFVPCMPPPTRSLPGGRWERSTGGAPRCRSRGEPAGQDRLRLGERGARLPHHRAVERTHRGREPAHREGPQNRPWIPQLRQLSAPAPSALWGYMADSPCRTNQRPSTTLGRVEPNIEHPLQALREVLEEAASPSTRCGIESARARYARACSADVHSSLPAAMLHDVRSGRS